MISADVLHGPWFLCAAILLGAVSVWRTPRPAASELWVAGAITVGAAVARLVCGLWGPLHINGQGPLWIRGALDPEALASYGPGYFELFGWVARLWGAPDRAIFTANALLSALCPALLYATARLVGVAGGAALAIAVVLAADAVTVRTAASESYFSSLIVLVLGVQALLAFGVQCRRRHDRWAASFALAAACLLAVTVARIHPVGYLPLALCPLVVLGAARPTAWRPRIALAASAGMAVAGAVLLISGGTIITALRASPMASDAFGGVTRRHGEVLAALVVAIWLVHRWARPPWLPLVGGLSLVVMLTTRDAFQQHPLWELCYERLFLPGMLLGAAPLLPRRLQWPGWALSVAVAGAIGLLVPALPHLRAPTTEQLEYRFLQETLRGTPPSCTLAAVSRAGMRVWDIPSYLLPAYGLDETHGLALESAADLRDAVVPGDCLLYVRSSLCASVEARALCDSIEREARLERLASRVFPAAPSRVDLPYDRSEVEVVVFQVREHGVAVARGRSALGPGRAITPDFAQALYNRLIGLRETDGCRLVRFDTERFRMVVGLQTPAGEAHAFELATATGGGGTSRRVGGWALAVPAEIERDCGATLAAVERVLEDLETPAPLHRIEPAERWLSMGAGLFLLAAAGLTLSVVEKAR